MNFPSLRYVLLKSYFPVAVLVAILLTVLDASTPAVVGQVRTVTVTETVRVLVTVTGFVTVTQAVYVTQPPVYVTVTQERIVMVIQSVFIPATTIITGVISPTVTLTSLVTSISTQTSVVSFSAGPIQIGPFSLDLADAGGLRFLGYTGGVVLVGFAAGTLFSHFRMWREHVKNQQPPPPPLEVDLPEETSHFKEVTGLNTNIDQTEVHEGEKNEVHKHTLSRKSARRPYDP